jgi:transposase, IS5 family
MIRDRYDPVQLFDLVPQLQLQFEPELAELDRLLEDEILFQQVKADLARRFPQSTVTGRPSTPVEVILRMLMVKHLHDWSYEETEHVVNDSLVLWHFCRLGLEKAPDDTTLLRWANLIQPEILHQLLDRVTELAQRHRITRGRKLRTDSTVVETDIHHPSDSTLLADGVRVISRLLRRARPVLPEGVGPQLFRDRTRSAKRWSRKIGELAARGSSTDGEDARVPVYQRLLAVTKASLRQAQQVRGALAGVPGRLAQRVRRDLDRVQPLVAQVIRQTERRVLQGERVSAREKVLSRFEPQTALIRRGKARQPTEFGAKVVLDEVEGGLITRYEVLSGNPPGTRLRVSPPSSCREWPIIVPPSAVRPIWWRPTAASGRRTMSRRRWRAGFAGLPYLDEVGAVPSDASGSGRAGSGGGITSGWGSKGGSVSCAGDSGWIAVATGERQGWSAGSALESLPITCGPSAATSRRSKPPDGRRAL